MGTNKGFEMYILIVSNGNPSDLTSYLVAPPFKSSSPSTPTYLGSKLLTYEHLLTQITHTT